MWICRLLENSPAAGSGAVDKTEIKYEGKKKDFEN